MDTIQIVTAVASILARIQDIEVILLIVALTPIPSLYPLIYVQMILGALLSMRWEIVLWLTASAIVFIVTLNEQLFWISMIPLAVYKPSLSFIVLVGILQLVTIKEVYWMSQFILAVGV